MMATLLSLWFSVLPSLGSDPGRAPAPPSPTSSVRPEDQSLHVLVWPLDDDSSTSPRRGRPEPFLAEEEETGDGDSIDSIPGGYCAPHRHRDSGRLAIISSRSPRLIPSDRSRVLRC